MDDNENDREMTMLESLIELELERYERIEKEYFVDTFFSDFSGLTDIGGTTKSNFKLWKSSKGISSRLLDDFYG